MKQFFFVRHGETEWNEKGLCQGARDIPLSQKGLESAEALGQRLIGIKIDRIISSPLQRAIQTAQVIQRFVPAPLQTDARLRERFFGSLEGCLSEGMYRFEQQEESGVMEADKVKFLNVEPLSAVRARLASFFLILTKSLDFSMLCSSRMAVFFMSSVKD